MKHFNTTPDYILFFAFLILLIFGVMLVYDASVVYSLDVFGGRYHYLLSQAIWAILGLICLAASYSTPYKILQKFSPIMYGFGIFLLILVLIPSVFSPEIYGAHRWLILPIFGGLSLQPSDIMKFSYVLYLSTILSTKNHNHSNLFIRFLLLTGLPAFLIIMEPDFGSALILCSCGVAMLFISGYKIRYIFSLIPPAILAAISIILTSNYRKERLLTFFNHSFASDSGSGYHISQILIALGSGGVFGLGWGQSRQKYGYLPEVSADSIFAILGEELGFIGTFTLIILISFIILRGFNIAMKCSQISQKIFVSGIITIFFCQTFLNILSQLKILPLTGVPLPLVSYGGSSLIFTSLGFGVLLSISREC